MPDGFFTGRGDVDGFEREGDFDEFFRHRKKVNPFE